MARFGSETLRPELFVDMTDVGRAQVSELGSLDFVALLRHRHHTRPPTREVRMGKNMSAHDLTAKKEGKSSPSKYYITTP